MKKRLLSLLLALLLLLSSLTGCASGAVDQFYDLGEEIAQLEDTQVELTAAYHGANLLVSGFISRTNQTADLTFTLSGTETGDGVWTEVRVDGNQIWLNVAEIAQRTLAFDLPALRQEDIRDLQSEQTADWVSYTWAGDLWEGIPTWSELLSQLWEDSRTDFEGHITASGTDYTLSLTDSTLETVKASLTARLEEHMTDYRESFISAMGQEKELVSAIQMEPDLFFDSQWSTLLEGDAEDGSEEEVRAVALKLSKGEDSYGISLSMDGSSIWTLTLTPVEAQTVQQPEDVMPFGAYGSSAYYLTTFSNTYIGDALDGVELDEIMEYESYVEEDMDPIVTGAAVGFADLATVQFSTLGGEFVTVPILTGYTSCTADSVNGEGELINGLNLGGAGWYQSVTSENAEGLDLESYLSETVRGYYEAYISFSGYLLVQDISETAFNADGTAAAQGFSFRENDYAEPEAELVILLTQPGGSGYTVLDFQLQLSKMSAADMAMVTDLCTYLGLEIPIRLDV